MLSLPEARRVGAGHHLDIVRRLTPEIADYPVNPPDRSFGVARMLRILTVEARGWRRPVALARRVAAALRRRRH